VDSGRLFWLLYVTVVAVFGLLALAATAIGSIGLREARIAGTAIAALLAGAAFFAGVHLFDRLAAPLAAWILVIGSPIAFVLLVNGLWSDEVGDGTANWAWTALIFVVFGLIIAGLRLLIPDDDPISRAVFLGASICLAITAALLVKEVWGSLGIAGDTRAGLSAFVLGVAGFLLAPALRRLREAGAS
jgi:hypothetical protein